MSIFPLSELQRDKALSQQATGPEASVPSFRVLGVRVSALQIADVVDHMEHWIQERKLGHFIAVTGMHGISESRRDPSFQTILNAADLVVPDGMPLVWLGRWNGFSLRRRVYGPELMETFCRLTASRYTHFLYGGAVGVPERMAEVMESKYGNRVVGAYSPPFRALTEEEREDVLARIRAANPNVLWVGISTPKQERWIAEHRDRLGIPVIIGVGAAFDFHTGRVRQAPRWMRENGMEWLFRLLAEPRRLWRRYLIYGSQFAWNVSLEILGIKSFS
jgi:N-acetylglucosaminyldiphosphoundecaprenol N-acetyl-beta-D-mannosaminyltransferase